MRTLAQLQLMVRRRLGWPSTDTVVSDAEIGDMLRQSQYELLDLLISLHNGNFREATLTQAITAGTNSATIAGAYRLVRCSVDFDSASVPMRPWERESSYIDRTSQPWTSTTDLRYRYLHMVGHDEAQITIQVYPTPTTTQILRVVHIVGPGTLSISTAYNTVGNDEYLVLDTMIKCIQAEEGDAGAVERKKAGYVEMLTNHAQPLDVGQAHTIQDVRTVSSNRDALWWPR